MRFGRARRAAAAVAPRFAAEQDDDIARCGFFAVDHIAPRAAHDKARFQTFRLIAAVIDFVHDARGKPDLVAVGGKTARRRAGDDALGKFAFERLVDALGGIRGARHAHRLIHVRAPR